MRTFLRSNPLLYRPRTTRALPVWFTLDGIAKQVGIRRNSALWHVQSGRLVPAARTSSGMDLFTEKLVEQFVAWHRQHQQYRKRHQHRGQTRRQGRKGRRGR